MNKFIYCGYPTIESSDFIIQMTSKGKIAKPTAGYISLEKALENYPETYSILKIEVRENAILSDEYPSTEIWKVYREEDIMSIEIV